MSTGIRPIKPKRNDKASAIFASIVIGIPLAIPSALCLGFAWRLFRAGAGWGT